jgi:hypothetical protein
VNYLLSAMCIAVCFAYVCRLDLLNLRRYKFGVILMHVGLLGVSAYAAGHAFTEDFDLHDTCGILAAVSWLIVSYQTWKSGAPEHYLRDTYA